MNPPGLDDHDSAFEGLLSAPALESHTSAGFHTNRVRRQDVRFDLEDGPVGDLDERVPGPDDSGAPPNDPQHSPAHRRPHGDALVVPPLGGVVPKQRPRRLELVPGHVHRELRRSPLGRRAALGALRAIENFERDGASFVEPRDALSFALGELRVAHGRARASLRPPQLGLAPSRSSLGFRPRPRIESRRRLRIDVDDELTRFDAVAGLEHDAARGPRHRRRHDVAIRGAGPPLLENAHLETSAGDGGSFH